MMRKPRALSRVALLSGRAESQACSKSGLFNIPAHFYFSEESPGGDRVRPNAWAQRTAPGAGEALDEEGGPPTVYRERAAWGSCHQDSGRNVCFVGCRVLFLGPEMMCIHFTGEGGCRPPLTLRGGRQGSGLSPLVPLSPYLLISSPPAPSSPFLLVKLTQVQSLPLRKSGRFSSGLGQSAGPAF